MVFEDIDELFSEDEEKFFGVYTTSASCRSSLSDVTLPALSAPGSVWMAGDSSRENLVPPQDVQKPEVSENCKPAHRPQPPDKIGNQLYRNLRWTFLTPYRRLMSFALFINLIFLALLLSIPSWRRTRLNYANTATATSVNIAMAVFLRQEHVVNSLFLSACKISVRAPLRLRCWLAKVYTYGGLHSGCALAATMWFAISTGFIFRHLVVEPRVDPSVAGVATTILLLLLLMTASAYPTFRIKYHDWFEGIHRFAGWTIVALFWTETMLITAMDARKTNAPFANVLVKSSSFWCLIIITCSIILPWLRLRPMTVRPERLSDHAIRLHFDGERATMGQGFRLSDKPLLENHAFAAIADPKGGDSFSVLISNAGDWTSSVIRNPPTRLWTRGLLQYGAIRVATLFQPVLVVATGSGIAPCLSLFNGAPDLQCRVLWSAPKPLETFGQGVFDTVLGKDPDAHIIDTRVSGRPDLVREAYWRYKAVGAEAVIVISNAAVTRKVVYGLESRGVPAFAPIFDS